MYRNILIATDGSELAAKGVEHGLSLALELNAKVTVITVTEPFPMEAAAGGMGWVPSQIDFDRYAEGQKEHAEGILSGVREAAQKLGIAADTKHVAEARPAEAIVQFAKDGGFGLIVMASHGRRGLKRLLLGSQTSEVLAESDVPVLVVR